MDMQIISYELVAVHLRDNFRQYGTLLLSVISDLLSVKLMGDKAVGAVAFI